MKTNALTLTGLKGVSSPDNLGKIVTLTMFLADCKDFSHRCEPAELFIYETNQYHNPQIFYREDGSSLVTEYRMKCNRDSFLHDVRYDDYEKAVRKHLYGDEYANGTILTDDIFLSGLCKDLFEKVTVYSL